MKYDGMAEIPRQLNRAQSTTTTINGSCVSVQSILIDINEQSCIGRAAHMGVLCIGHSRLRYYIAPKWAVRAIHITGVSTLPHQREAYKEERKNHNE